MTSTIDELVRITRSHSVAEAADAFEGARGAHEPGTHVSAGYRVPAPDNLRVGVPVLGPTAAPAGADAPRGGAVE